MTHLKLSSTHNVQDWTLQEILDITWVIKDTIFRLTGPMKQDITIMVSRGIPITTMVSLVYVTEKKH